MRAGNVLLPVILSPWQMGIIALSEHFLSFLALLRTRPRFVADFAAAGPRVNFSPDFLRFLGIAGAYQLASVPEVGGDGVPRPRRAR
jgi:hypothetical protein